MHQSGVVVIIPDFCTVSYGSPAYLVTPLLRSTGSTTNAQTLGPTPPYCPWLTANEFLIEFAKSAMSAQAIHASVVRCTLEMGLCAISGRERLLLKFQPNDDLPTVSSASTRPRHPSSRPSSHSYKVITKLPFTRHRHKRRGVPHGLLRVRPNSSLDVRLFLESDQ